MVYLDTDLNGQKDAAQYPRESIAPLDAAYWTGKGTTLLGVAKNLTLIGVEDATNASIEAYAFGHPSPPSDGSSFPNPLPLNAGEVKTVVISSEFTPIRIVSDKPVIALGSDGITSGVVPSLDGRVLGTQFHFVNYLSAGFYVYAPGGSANVVVNGRSVALSPGSPL